MQNHAPQQDIITPAEAQFWADWAAKAPALIRYSIAQNIDPVGAQFDTRKNLGFAVGAAFGIAMLTKYVPGKWKLLSGAAAGASFGLGTMAGQISAGIRQSKAQFTNYADALEKEPALQQQLAHFLSATVSAENIQAYGIENAVFNQAMAFGAQTPYLQLNAQDRASISR